MSRHRRRMAPISFLRQITLYKPSKVVESTAQACWSFRVLPTWWLAVQKGFQRGCLRLFNKSVNPTYARLRAEE